MTFGDDCGGVLGDFGMLLRALGGLGPIKRRSGFSWIIEIAPGSKARLQCKVIVWFGRPKTVDSILDLGYWRQDPGDRIQDFLQDAGMYPNSAACWP